MKSANNIVLKSLGSLLLVAAVLKGWQLLIEPIANKDIWTNRAFLIFTVEFELALAIWLLAGLFKKAAWLAALSCFSLFSFITFYKGITGAESCGCFGSVDVNPWITLFAIDIPAVIALSAFRPGLSLQPVMSFLRKQEPIGAVLIEFLTPLPSLRRLVIAFTIGFTTLCVTTPILAFNAPVKVTSSYEVLEPETWIGKELPILEYIDIAELLKKGTWLVLFYHHDCPDCAEAIPKYEQMARDLADSEDFLRIALIEVPPYGRDLASKPSPCALGQLANVKEWFITTPAMVLLKESKVMQTWEQKLPNLGRVLDNISAETREKSLSLERR